MKARLLALLLLFISIISFAQSNRELYLTSGYKNSMGYIGLNYLFLTHPKLPLLGGESFKRYNFRVGFGFDLVHSVRFATGVDYNLLKNRKYSQRDKHKIIPIVSIDGIAAFQSTLGDKDENIWVIKNNFYINPSVGAKYIYKRFVFRLQAGYSFLFGKPEIEVTNGTLPPDKEHDYVNNIDGGFMLTIGAGLHFDRSNNKIERDGL